MADIAPLKISLVRQDPQSDDCLRACAQMVFAYFKEPITKEEIWKRLHVYKKHSGLRGGYTWDLGRLAIRKGYDPLIMHYDWHWWTKNTVGANSKGKKSLIAALKELKKQKLDWAQKKEVAKEVKYAKAGGKYKIILPSTETIDSYLSARIPVIINVRSEDLYKNPNENYAHSIVVVGKEGINYILRDPYLALEKISSEELKYAWSRTGGWMMVLIPNPTKRQAVKTPKATQRKLL